jgi:hypothetical protein
LVDRSTLMSLLTSGTARSAMRSVADGSMGTPNLADQDNKNAGRTVAATLAYARTAKPATAPR